MDAGRVLGIFPEGRIAPPGELLPFQTGVALMALKKCVSVYPACLDGTQRGKSMIQAMLLPQAARIAFGRPLNLDAAPGAGDRLEVGTARIRQAVAELCPAVR